MKTPSKSDHQPICFHLLSSQENKNARVHKRKTIKKRQRKSFDQLHILAQEFSNCLDWDKDSISKLAKKTGLSEAQIYKWSWDQKKKVQQNNKIKNLKVPHLCEIFDKLPDVGVFYESKKNLCLDFEKVCCREIICPRVIDLELFRIQKNYRACFESFLQVKMDEDKGLDKFLGNFKINN